MKKPLAPDKAGDSPEIERMRAALDAVRNAPPERSISAMPVVVAYTGVLGRVLHDKRGEEHFFYTTLTEKDDSPNQRWEEKPLNAHAIRDEFLKVRDWSGAYDFLSNTGTFSILSNTITWGEFERWQEFTRLVLEHDQLANTMQTGHWKGEHAEVLKALTGNYPSSFFKGYGDTVSPEETDWLDNEKRLHPEIVPELDKAEYFAERQRRELWTWFRQPPGNACSIVWLPKRTEDETAVLPKLNMGGAMIEFLLPRQDLRPVFVIHPKCTLQAIAATIFADHRNGIEYRTCEFCKELFPVGSQKTKKFCNQSRCKNAAHSRHMRNKKREEKMQAGAKRELSKRRKRGRKQAH